MTTPALVFDLDGTLIDTAPDLLDALNAILAEEGRRPVNLSDIRLLVGHGSRVTVEEAMKMTGAPAAPERVDTLVDRFVEHYRGHIADKSRPFPGVEETLTKLEGEGARMALLSNKPQVLVDLLMPKIGLAKFFRAIHGAGRLEVVKPNARVFHHVIDEIGGIGSGAVMIGDSATDVATARAANVSSIVLTYGYSSEPVEKLGADRVTDDFRKIPVLVKKLLGT